MRIAIGTAALFLVALGCAHEKSHLKQGRPVYDKDSLPAYWIWSDGDGWHLRTTTSRELHRFQGVIEPVDGQFTAAHPTRPELASMMSSGPTKIVFEITSEGFDDGIDWQVTSGCNRFTLNVDNEPLARRVKLGADGVDPLSIPFVRCE